MNKEETKEYIFSAIDDMIIDFLVYDRKDDQFLPTEVTEHTVKNGDQDIDELVDRFKDGLIQSI